AAIAARLGISERAVTMLFRSQTGLTPMAWRAQRRG
ncbi:MAG: AraC family transcriptional regulator, partial [Myxococcales bacterium]